jgi:hypothetical protein
MKKLIIRCDECGREKILMGQEIAIMEPIDVSEKDLCGFCARKAEVIKIAQRGNIYARTKKNKTSRTREKDHKPQTPTESKQSKLLRFKRVLRRAKLEVRTSEKRNLPKIIEPKKYKIIHLPSISCNAFFDNGKKIISTERKK